MISVPEEGAPWEANEPDIMAGEAAASRVLAKRRALGITQEDLAQAAGVSRQAIGAIESGRAQPGVALALAIARTLQTTAEELFGERREEELRVNADEPLRRGQRVVLAEFGRRRIVRGLDGAGSTSPVPESAQGIVAEVSAGVATVRVLQGGLPFERTVLVSGCEIGLGLLVRRLDARRAHGLWFSASNRRAVADLAARRAHVAAIHGSKDELKRAVALDSAAGSLGRLRRFELAAGEAGWLVPKGNPLGLRERCSTRNCDAPHSTRGACRATSASSRGSSTSRERSHRGSPTPGSEAPRRLGSAGSTSSRCAPKRACCSSRRRAWNTLASPSCWRRCAPQPSAATSKL